MTCTVVYIDDEPHLCTVFKEFFSSSTSSVYTFTEAEPAIDFCEKNNVDMVVIDFRLVGTTGDEVAREISQKVPKILVTGELTNPTSFEFDHIVYKPFKLAELRSIMSPYLATCIASFE